jgi:hypothetical protein
MKDLKKTIKEAVKEAVAETIQEKKTAFSDLSFHGQITETVQEFCGLSIESFRTVLKFIECFSIFFVLVNAVYQLKKEFKSPF